MATITLNIPDALKGVQFTTEQIRRFELSLLPEMAEAHALGICKKKFGMKFKLGDYNSKGFDVISNDTSIVVEVKQTSAVMNLSKRLQIGSYNSKENLCTHILILDYYSNRCAILEHDDFFYKTHQNEGSSGWRWDSEYNMNGSTRCKENTEWFLKNEVEL
jgi:hypothetical protein